MTFWRQWMGRYGEMLAEKTLKKNGCVILEKNFSTPQGEIDIIAKNGKILIFCEVRSRRLTATDTMTTIGESINRTKQRRLAILAEIYLQRHPDMQSCCCRFDVVLVAKQNKKWQVDWIQDAFRPGM
ncbi:MAG: protein of unknown function UPF0102 [Magnetococcales bacterium]|nr:protein of unknown function UPF0102 [Magnetococcales bacterium]HIJ85567.1 YraN family protein [Magnetococcales bacterium]